MAYLRGDKTKSRFPVTAILLPVVQVVDEPECSTSFAQSEYVVTLVDDGGRVVVL